MFLLICITTTSCWSRREIESLGFVIGLGISKTDAGLYSVVAQVANTGMLAYEGASGKDIYTIIKAEGLTFFDALRNMSIIAKRRLYIAHIKSLIIHEDIAKEGLAEVVGFIVQDMEVRLEMKVFISKVPPADILDTPNYVGIIPAMGLSATADNFGANNKIYVADFHEMVEMINNPVLNYVTTLVEQVTPPAKLEKSELILSQIAVFENDKLKGYLDYQEGQAFNIISNHFTNGLISFEYMTNKDKIVIEGVAATTKVIPSYQSGEISFNIDVKFEGNVAERISKQDSPHELDMALVHSQLNKV